MKYAHIDSNNKLLGWYSDDVHSTIPTPNVVVTDEQWQTSLDNNYNSINSDGSGSVVDFSTDAEKTSMVRGARDAELAATDWRALSDVTMSDEWRTYRQALRDVPAQAGFPTNVTWPVEPSQFGSIEPFEVMRNPSSHERVYAVIYLKELLLEVFYGVEQASVQIRSKQRDNVLQQ